MSESLPKLDVEPEWCSAVVLSSISATPEASGQPTAELVKPTEAEPASEPIPLIAAESTPASTESPASPKPMRSEPKSRPHSKSSRSKRLPATSRVHGWLAALRSRRTRIVATVVSLVFVGGLIVLNWKGSSSDSHDEAADMDLSEFNHLSGLDQPRIDSVDEPQPLRSVTEAESNSGEERFSQIRSQPRLPPLGLVTHADHERLSTSPAEGVVPASASFTGSRGAVLTGQIEFDTPQSAPAASGRIPRNLGVR